MSTSLRSCADAGGLAPRLAWTMPIESSTVTNRSPAPASSRLGAPEARQDDRLGAASHVRAVELGRDLHREPAPLHRRRRHVGVRRRGHEVATEADEHVDLAAVHRAEGVDRVEAGLARRREAEARLEGVEQRRGRLLEDAHRAVALHVGVAAHRAGPGARLADGAAQQQGVDELLDRGDGLAVLGQPHRPADDDPLPAGDPAVQLVDRLAIEPGGRQQGVGIERVEVGAQLVEPVAVGVDERPVEGVVVVHQAAVEQLEQRQVGADHDRQVQVGERGAAAEHAADALRVAERQ